MTVIDWRDLDDEILWFIRNNVSDPQGRTSQDTLVATTDGVTTYFEIGTTPVQNIRSVIIGGTTQSFGTDYAVNINTISGTACVKTTVAAGSDLPMTVTYNYGNTWIYPDLPRSDLKIGSYPRIAVMNVDSAMTQIGLGTGMTRTAMLKEIRVYGRTEHETKGIINDVKNAIVRNKNQLYNATFMQPVGVTRLAKEPDRDERIVAMSMDMEMPFIFEA